MTGILITIKPLRWIDKYDEVKRACDAFEFMRVLLEYDSMQLSASPATGIGRLLSWTSHPGVPKPEVGGLLTTVANRRANQRGRIIEDLPSHRNRGVQVYRYVRATGDRRARSQADMSHEIRAPMHSIIGVTLLIFETPDN
jgi:signal transduction histidine kinase